MRDLSTIKTKLGAAAQEVANPAPKHQIRVPQSLKDEMKIKGAKFNKEDGWHFASHAPDIHPLGVYRVGGERWVEVTNIPFDLTSDLKEHGMVSEKSQAGIWSNYVHYLDEELLAVLAENTVLNIGFTLEQ
jgi:hypothetical protein